MLYVLAIISLSHAYHDNGGYFTNMSPVGNEGDVIFGSRSKCIYRANPMAPEGQEVKKRFHVGGTIIGAPAVLESGDIVFGATNGWIMSIDSEFNLKWGCKVKTVESQPAVSEAGRVYVTSKDGYLYAFDPPGVEAGTTLSVAYEGVNCKSIIGEEPVPLVWRKKLSQSRKGSSSRFSPVIVKQSPTRILVGTSGNEGGVLLIEDIGYDSTYLGDHILKGHKFKIGGTEPLNGVVYTAARDLVAAIDITGPLSEESIVWQTPLDDVHRGKPVFNKDKTAIIIGSRSTNELFSVDLDGGAPTTLVTLPANIAMTVAVDPLNDNIFVGEAGSGDSFHCVDMSSGGPELVTHQQSDPRRTFRSTPYVGPNYVTAGSNKGEIFILDRLTWDHLKTLDLTMKKERDLCRKLPKPY